MPQPTTDIFNRFEDHVRRNDLFRKGDLLYLAVSGGLDSVVLADLVFRAGMNAVILHVNFQLRGKESDRDQSFVEALGPHYGFIVKTNVFDTLEHAGRNKLSVQEAARELRYAWFRLFLDKGPSGTGRKFIVTAHHSDDNVETLLQHFFQGSGIAGLHGIPAIQGGVVRPLLFARRSELEAYAKERGLTWVDDSSNATVKYTRNTIRHVLLPAIEQVFPQVRENLSDNLGRFREIETLYRQALDRQLKRLLFEAEGGWKIPVERLRRTEPLRTIVWELFSCFGFTVGQSSGIIDLLDSPSGRYIDSSTHRLLHDRKWLMITPLKEQVNGVLLIEQGQRSLTIPGGEIRISLDRRTGDDDVPKAARIACIDAKDIKFPLLVRKWKPGDYFYPLGMRKKQKVARFLINAKVDRNAKERVLVVESNKRILWVVGHRIDDRFKLMPGSRERLTLVLVPS